jgi:transcriptional regulator with XRE-family HTH domain
MSRFTVSHLTVADSASVFCDAAQRSLSGTRLRGISLLPGSALEPMSERFGERLRRLRNEQGYTAVDLAAAVGTSESTIRQLETGNVKSPNFLLGIRLADQLKVDPRYLALGEGLGVAARFESLEHRVEKLERRVAAIPAARR